MSGQNKKIPCPECGNLMAHTSALCRSCRYPNMQGAPLPENDNGRVKAAFGVIVSFENADRRTLVLHRAPGTIPGLRKACEDALTLDSTFRVVCVSTPTSIYTDMQGARMAGKQASKVVGTSDRAFSPEAQMLGRAGLAEMLHPRLAA